MKKIIHKIVKNSGIIEGTIPIYIKNNEYVNIYPFTKESCEWLEIIDKNVNFDTEQIFNIRYNIDTSKIKSGYGNVKVVIDEINDKNAEIEVVVIPDFSAAIDRKNFLYNDSGIITVKNNTAKSAEINVSASESFIKFENRNKNEGYISIPFKIKVPLIVKTQAEISGKPYITADITVSFIQNDNKQEKTFNITVGTAFVG